MSTKVTSYIQETNGMKRRADGIDSALSHIEKGSQVRIIIGNQATVEVNGGKALEEIQKALSNELERLQEEVASREAVMAAMELIVSGSEK